MVSFVSQAFAADDVAAAASTAGGDLFSFLPLIVIFGIFYFMLIRPQMKKQKEHQAMVASITKGERVTFAGGLVGTIIKIEDENFVQIEIATDVKVLALKSSIIDVLEKQKKVKDTEEKVIAKKQLKAKSA